jgi:hypothetical protein
MIGSSQHLRISWESKWWWCHDMHWGWMQTAYHTMVDGHQILVDYNRQQLMPGWIPRRLGNTVSYLEPKGMIWQMFQPCMCRIFLMLPIIFLWKYLFNPNQNISNRVCNLESCFPWCWNSWDSSDLYWVEPCDHQVLRSICMSGVNVTDVFLFYQSSAMFILALMGLFAVLLVSLWHSLQDSGKKFDDWCLARQVEALVGRKNQGNSDLEVENVHSGHLCKFLFFQSPKLLLYLLLFSWFSDQIIEHMS